MAPITLFPPRFALHDTGDGEDQAEGGPLPGARTLDFQRTTQHLRGERRVVKAEAMRITC